MFDKMSHNIQMAEIPNSSSSYHTVRKQQERSGLEQFISEEQRQAIETHDSDDSGEQEQERPCLERMTSEDKRMMRQIFDTLDVNHDEFISKRELKKYIKEHPHGKLPKNLAKNIMDVSDTNLDGRLDFDEFCVLDTKYKWLFTWYIRRYAEIVTSKPKSYEHNMRIYPPPLAMISVSIIEIFLFLVDVIYKAIRHLMNNDSNDGLTDGPASALFIYNPHRRYEVWRFFTYIFVHAEVLHISMNLIVQIFLGFILELRHGWWRVAIVYVAGVLAASMGKSIMEPHDCLRGASGGVYAIILAHIGTTIMNWNEMEYGIVRAFVFAVFLTTDFGYSTYLRFTGIPVPGYTAHSFGALAGLLVGIGALKNFNERRWEVKLWWCAVSLYSLLMFAGVFIHAFFAHQLDMLKWNSSIPCTQ